MQQTETESPQKNVLNSSSSHKSSEYRTRQEQINSLTKELHNHYFLEKYFVDPDKTFGPLLEKIIVSFLFNGHRTSSRTKT